MTATITELDAELMASLEPPCEAAFAHERESDVPPAEWIAWWVCPCQPDHMLICTGCKDELLKVGSLWCEGCRVTFIPSSAAIRLIEPLNRRPQ